MKHVYYLAVSAAHQPAATKMVSWAEEKNLDLQRSVRTGDMEPEKTMAAMIPTMITEKKISYTKLDGENNLKQNFPAFSGDKWL